MDSELELDFPPFMFMVQGSGFRVRVSGVGFGFRIGVSGSPAVPGVRESSNRGGLCFRLSVLPHRPAERRVGNSDVVGSSDVVTPDTDALIAFDGEEGQGEPGGSGGLGLSFWRLGFAVCNLEFGGSVFGVWVFVFGFWVLGVRF